MYANVFGTIFPFVKKIITIKRMVDMRFTWYYLILRSEPL